MRNLGLGLGSTLVSPIIVPYIMPHKAPFKELSFWFGGVGLANLQVVAYIGACPTSELVDLRLCCPNWVAVKEFKLSYHNGYI